MADLVWEDNERARSVQPAVTEPFDPDKTTVFSTPSVNPPGPGWWLAEDGEWYPPSATQDVSPGPGYWKASDGQWYPPGPNETTTIAPVPVPNQYQGWQPQPQPHDELRALTDAPTAGIANEGIVQRDGFDVPLWAKVIGVAVLLLLIAALATTALDISIPSS